MSTHTFDQGFIQNNRTGTFTKTIEVVARCKAFSHEGIRRNRIEISADKTVRVWDSIAGHFTRCHVLSPATQRRIIAAAAL